MKIPKNRDSWGNFVALYVFLACSGTLVQESPVRLRHGTIILWEETATKVMIVSDSRTYDEEAGVRGQTCKIIDLSDGTLFFYTGSLLEASSKRTHEKVFSQQMFAKRAYDALKMEPKSYDRLNRIARKYSELVRLRMDELFKTIPHPSRMTGLAGFASLDEFKHARLVLVRIPIEVPNDGAPTYTGMPAIFEPSQNKLGLGDYPPYNAVNEFLDGNSERAKKAVADFKLRTAKLPKRDLDVHNLIAAVEASLNWNKDDPTIGPPVDAVVIESGRGIRWIKRKPECTKHVGAED